MLSACPKRTHRYKNTKMSSDSEAEMIEMVELSKVTPLPNQEAAEAVRFYNINTGMTEFWNLSGPAQEFLYEIPTRKIQSKIDSYFQTNFIEQGTKKRKSERDTPKLKKASAYVKNMKVSPMDFLSWIWNVKKTYQWWHELLVKFSEITLDLEYDLDPIQGKFLTMVVILARNLMLENENVQPTDCVDLPNLPLKLPNNLKDDESFQMLLPYEQAAKILKYWKQCVHEKAKELLSSPSTSQEESNRTSTWLTTAHGPTPSVGALGYEDSGNSEEDDVFDYLTNVTKNSGIINCYTKVAMGENLYTSAWEEKSGYRMYDLKVYNVTNVKKADPKDYWKHAAQTHRFITKHRDDALEVQIKNLLKKISNLGQLRASSISHKSTSSKNKY